MGGAVETSGLTWMAARGAIPIRDQGGQAHRTPMILIGNFHNPLPFSLKFVQRQSNDEFFGLHKKFFFAVAARKVAPGLHFSLVPPANLAAVRNKWSALEC